MSASNPRRSSPHWRLLPQVLACAGWIAVTAVRADALSALNDAEVFRKAQADIGSATRAELDLLAEAVATCSAVSVGQRQQQYDCERQVNLYWVHCNRGRDIDNYMAAFGGLLAAFDNNATSPTEPMMQTYRNASTGLVTLMRSINQRYRQLDK